MRNRIHATWLAPDDHGGGVIAVVAGCCRAATAAGDIATLLLMLPPTGRGAEFGGVTVDTLGFRPPGGDAPTRLIDWLQRNPQDVVLLNGCVEVESAIPFIPRTTRSVYVVHDTAPRYFEAAIRHEAALDAIVAVSETVAARFRHRLADPAKLTVIHNGSIFPVPLDAVAAARRDDDLLFLGGDRATKGAADVVALWPHLRAAGFAGRLHWFGSVNPRLRARIVELGEGIVLHGHAPRAAVFEAALGARVLLMPSRDEPFGMATIECMGMGCSVAAWSVPAGTREVTGPRDAAFAPLGDLPAFARATLQMLALPDDDRIAMAERVRLQFDEGAMWSRYDALLSSLMRRPPALRPHAGAEPPPYRPPVRLFQRVPGPLRSAIREAVGRSPTLSYALRDMRGR